MILNESEVLLMVQSQESRLNFQLEKKLKFSNTDWGGNPSEQSAKRTDQSLHHPTRRGAW